MEPSWLQTNGGNHAHDPDAEKHSDEVYARLKASAELNKRSLNSEAIVCLETMLTPGQLLANERLRRARALREQIGQTFMAEELDQLIREGRE